MIVYLFYNSHSVLLMIIIQNMTQDTTLEPLIQTIYTTLEPHLSAINAHKSFDTDSEVTLRLVESNEITELNTTYRAKPNATNVLSFPDELPKEVSSSIGDVVICTEVVAREANAQGKMFNHHLTHILLHGVLHLLGYDHETQEEATTMEQLEISILQYMNISNPYE